MSTAALEAVDRIVNRGGTMAEVVHGVVRALVERGGCTWAQVESASGVEPIEAGTRGNHRLTSTPIERDGRPAGVLHAQGCADDAHLARVALLVSPYCEPAAA